MTRCHCTTPNCPAPLHRSIVCAQPAEIEAQSRDWGEEIIPMCYVCWIDARSSGMFRRAMRSPQLTARVETVVDGRLC